MPPLVQKIPSVQQYRSLPLQSPQHLSHIRPASETAFQKNRARLPDWSRLSDRLPCGLTLSAYCQGKLNALPSASLALLHIRTESSRPVLSWIPVQSCSVLQRHCGTPFPDCRCAFHSTKESPALHRDMQPVQRARRPSGNVL